MSVRITIEPQLSDAYSPNLGHLPVVLMYVNIDGFIYPGKGWFDDGLVVLSAWLTSARHLLLGGESESFPFKEGPFSFVLSRITKETDVEISFRSRQERRVVNILDFTQELVNTARHVVDILSELDGLSGYCKALSGDTDEVDRVLQDMHGR